MSASGVSSLGATELWAESLLAQVPRGSLHSGCFLPTWPLTAPTLAETSVLFPPCLKALYKQEVVLSYIFIHVSIHQIIH